MDTQDTFTALPVQIVDLPDGTLVRRGATQLWIAGSGLRLILDLIFALASAEGTSKTEISDLVLPRFPDLSKRDLSSLFDNLIASRLLLPRAAGNSETDSEPSIQVFRWECGASEGRSLGEVRFAVAGVNQIARELKSALFSCGVERVTVIDDPVLRSTRLSHQNGTVDAAAWGHAMPLAQEQCASLLDSGIDLLLAVSEFGNQHAFRRWNQLAVERGIPFLPVLLADHIGQVGPLVQPGHGPCLECLRARQNANLDQVGLLRASEETSHLQQDAIGFLPPMANVLGGIAAIEAVKYWLNARRFDSVGHMLEVDLLTSVMNKRKVLKIPRCRVCAATGRQASTRLSKTLPIAEMS